MTHSKRSLYVNYPPAKRIEVEEAIAQTARDIAVEAGRHDWPGSEDILVNLPVTTISRNWRGKHVTHIKQVSDYHRALPLDRKLDLWVIAGGHIVRRVSEYDTRTRATKVLPARDIVNLSNFDDSELHKIQKIALMHLAVLSGDRRVNNTDH